MTRMRHLVLKAGIVLLALSLLGNTPTGSVSSSQSLTEEAYFKFHTPPDPGTFTIRLTDPAKIAQARAILAENQPIHVMGKIVKQTAPYNPPWSYHLDPNTIEFFHSATEVCDATITYVEEHLNEACGAFLPDCTWCPWGSQLIEEVRPVESTSWLYFPLLAH